MEERRRLLEKLVVLGHLNVSERQVLGPVTRLEVADLVKSLLIIQGVFPLHGSTGAVYEGATIRQVQSGAEVTWARAYAGDPFTVAQSRTETFSDVDAAIQNFIDTEWSNGIDGVIPR